MRLYPDIAAAAARAADGRLAREGDDAPVVCGIPIGVKDLYGVAGLPLTASSRVLDGNVATEDAVAWARLAEAGMVLVGHTHTHEFAAGGTSDQVGNPWALDRSAGGSSGGSAAALAALMVPAAVGTDTAGSLRIPSAMCGTTAIKATHGRVPIDGIIPLSASLDHAGPMGRSVADCAALLGAMAAGGAQTTPLMPPPAPLGALPTGPREGSRPLAGVRIAVTDRVGTVPVEREVLDGLEAARAAAERLGATVVDLPGAADPSFADFSQILFAEVAAHHARYADRNQHYRVSIRQFVDLGARFGSAPAYVRAQERRAEATARWEAWFDEHRIDAVLEPTVAECRAAARRGLRLGAARWRGRPADRLHRELEHGRPAGRRAPEWHRRRYGPAHRRVADRPQRGRSAADADRDRPPGARARRAGAAARGGRAIALLRAYSSPDEYSNVDWYAQLPVSSNDSGPSSTCSRSA